MDWHEKIRRVIVPTCGILLLIGVLICFSDIVARNTAGSSIPWAQQITVWSVITVTFLVAGVQLKDGTHIFVDFVIRKIEGMPRRIIDFFNNLIVAVFSFFLLYSTIHLILTTYKTGIVEPLGTWVAPRWIVYLVCMLVGLVMLSIYSIVILIRTLLKKAENLPERMPTKQHKTQS